MLMETGDMCLKNWQMDANGPQEPRGAELIWSKLHFAGIVLLVDLEHAFFVRLFIKNVAPASCA